MIIFLFFIIFWNQIQSQIKASFSFNWKALFFCTFELKRVHFLAIWFSSLQKLRISFSLYLNLLVADSDAFDRSGRTIDMLLVTRLSLLFHNFVSDKFLYLLWIGTIIRVVVRQCWMWLRGNCITTSYFDTNNVCWLTISKVECYFIHFAAIKQARYDAWNFLIC